MSFDPYGTSPDPIRPNTNPPADPTAPIDVSMNATPGGRPPGEIARDRVQLPGIFLIVVGVLNLLYGGMLGLTSYRLHTVPAEEIDKVKQEMRRNPKQRKQLEELEAAGYEMEPLMRTVGTWFGGGGVIALIIGMLGILGGIRMLQLRSYAICLIASLVSAVPVLSGAGCCCIGEAVGIWGLVVLLTNEVRGSFR